MKILVFAFLILGTSAFSNAEEVKRRTIKARTLELVIPVDWKPVNTAATTRVAQFSIGDEPDSADLVAFYFGGPTGGVKANVNRWLGQFQKKDRQVEMLQGKCQAGLYVWVDTIGTWDKPDGPPFAQKKITTPNSRVVNIILIEQKAGAEDYYFLKLSGPKETVSKHIGELRSAIGIQRKTEATFELKDAPN
jgi:hypothetical protein